MTQPQNSRATKVTVIDRPTESPTNRGWIRVWTTKFSSE